MHVVHFVSFTSSAAVIMSDAHFPIDISVNKLLEWLVSRRHCSKDWQKNLVPVREKINIAIQDMPELDEVRELLSGSFINYFNCQRLVEILKETEKDTKNFFGCYSSQRMKDWLEVIRLYKVDNVYLADAAQQLTRTINYEIPSMKRQINKNRQLQEESVSKEEAYLKSSAEVRTQFERECQKLGIKGVHVKSELLSLLKELPGVFDDVANSVAELKPAIDFYRAFINFTLGHNLPDAEFLPLTHYILKKGNTTTYEWRSGRVPDVVAERRPSSPVNIETASDEQINFGDSAADEAISLESTSQSNGDFVHLDQIDFGADGDDNISWDIAIQDDGSGSNEAANGGISGSDEGGADVAQGIDALSVLHNPTTREMFLNELREIECFLTQRLEEMLIEGDVLLVSIMQKATEAIQSQSVASVHAMVERVKALLGSLTSHKMLHLYQLHSSPKYVDRLFGRWSNWNTSCILPISIFRAGTPLLHDVKKPGRTKPSLSPSWR
ncbi:CDK5 regulatory subunit-associated protein 3-like isoform X2 [Varroa destructor]|uniref:CDK5 regulatory subunit-associated protein 3 n=1 Tax=Varroa destructor TaxID=109461 RepID=A0A7M7JRE1_VARDE|nr:CDK5 regulatory subunit-associated protein 3-like isoform X2 [Varroa destructor]